MARENISTSIDLASQFVLFLLETGLLLQNFFQQLFLNYLSSFFVLDVIISAIVLFIFVLLECSKLEISHWWLPIVATFTVRVFFGLPLLVYMRKLNLAHNSAEF